jgi:hypothetical protein
LLRQRLDLRLKVLASQRHGSDENQGQTQTDPTPVPS